MKRFFFLLTSLFGTLGLAAATHAATLSPGDLIKGPTTAAVYYYDSHGKRLVFPTEKTYFTWYAGFTGVKTLTETELAAITLGGNVTYRPGVKLVKVTTDPKVYAVAKGGVLRHVTTEALAASLYGADWNMKIDDIPDAFFTNYTVGSPIQNTGDYSPSAETSAATTIDADRTPTTPPPGPEPTPTSTAPTYELSVSKTQAQPGDILTLTGTASGTQVTKVELFFDGILIKSCPSTLSCAGETEVPLSGTKESYVAESRFTLIDQTVVARTANVVISQGGTSSLVHLKIAQTQIMPGQLASVVVQSDASIAVLRSDIYVDGINVEGCATSSHECGWSDVIQGATSSVHPVYGKVTDTLGRVYTSKVTNIILSTYDTPGVTITPAKNSIYAGETLDVTVSATDSNGIAWIELLKDGQVLKHCDSAQPCTATTGPWMTAGTVLTFSGRAGDGTGTVGTAAENATVTVTSAP